MPSSPGRAVVYPRVGGGTGFTNIFETAGEGLSPRGRGNRHHRAPRGPDGGSIPAWAGEPGVPPSGSGISRVYPRVGGGTGAVAGVVAGAIGLSPRGRGNRRGRRGRRGRDRSIPAWAGEPPHDGPPRQRRGVYPRVGGGTVARGDGHPPESGLSPRGRGNQVSVHIHVRGKRSIPAWAGEPPSGALSGPIIAVYPRVGGGTLRACPRPRRPVGLSPRGRGNPQPTVRREIV